MNTALLVALAFLAGAICDSIRWHATLRQKIDEALDERADEVDLWADAHMRRR